MNNITYIEEEKGVKYDPILDEHIKKHPNPFPEKLVMATAFIEKNGLPDRFKHPKKRKSAPPSLELTHLQKELLYFYSNEPSAQQMEKLKDFLVQLLAEETHRKEEKAELIV